MGRPKALCTLRGETFVARLVRALAAAGCGEVIVVLGAHAEAVRAAVPGCARVVHNGEWRRGMRASLRAAVAAARPGPLVLTHVDRPLVAPATLTALVAACGVTIPTHRGEPGHPVRLPAALRPRLLAADDTPLSALLARARPRHLPVDDPGVCLNVNTPADLTRLRILAAAPCISTSRA
ncbi:MAG: NTP transferase domain-containing protein [Myxococcales bacterium]|nr:NTP transferase domain-containing protein [Myxococcales bacterium]